MSCETIDCVVVTYSFDYHFINFDCYRYFSFIVCNYGTVKFKCIEFYKSCIYFLSLSCKIISSTYNLLCCFCNKLYSFVIILPLYFLSYFSWKLLLLPVLSHYKAKASLTSFHRPRFSAILIKIFSFFLFNVIWFALFIENWIVNQFSQLYFYFTRLQILFANL